jgi:DICT domain-containing protein
VLPKKLAVKGLVDGVLDVNPVLHRKADYRADWDRNLTHLLPPGAEMSFEDAWERTVDFMQRVDQALRNKDQVNPCF